MATIFAFFGITDYVTAQRMTLKEFNIRQRARDMQMLDEEKRVYLLAFQIRQAQASKKDGLYIFEKFEDFYNEEERRRTVLNRSQGPAVNQELIEIAKRLQKRRKEGGIDG
jgi:ORF39